MLPTSNPLEMFTRVFIAFIGVFHLCSCTSKIDSPLVDFAEEHIRKTCEEQQMDMPTLIWELDSLELSAQSYAFFRKANQITIRGGDERGLMYGGLEVAEQLSLFGKVEDTQHSPYLLRRGLKMNIPLDARTPSYDDSGDAAIKNVQTVWEWDFWQKHLDQMALNRYNVLSFWNPHPFPSMIKLEEYPEVALEDIYTTSYKPTGLENEMGDPQMVSSVVFEHLELVKTQSIEDKIAFWQKVMQYAQDRGIDIYWITWNICPNSVSEPVKPGYKTFGINMTDEKPGKHGITAQMDNPLTLAYHRAAVKQFLLTYPLVKGIGVTAGEHMPLKWEGKNREEWLWESYGLGILDAKKIQPQRNVEFIHRVWHSDMEQIMKYWEQYPDPFTVSFKYAKARLYSSPSINFYEDHVKSMTQHGLKSWWNLRNDDIFVYRWANIEYVRQFLANLPKGNTQGYYMGSDGYFWGREFVSKVPELSGEYEFQKHDLRFMLWGRLGYNNELSDSVFYKTFEKKYGEGQAQSLFSTWQKASEIIPQVNRFHWRNWDADWSVESCRARPMLGGFRDIFDFVSNPVMPGQNLINCQEYVKKKLANQEIHGRTPLEVAQDLIFTGDKVLIDADLLFTEDLPMKTLALLMDIQAMGYMGKYYGHKIQAATHLAFYQQTQKKSFKEQARSEMEKAFEAVMEYARISNAHYHPQMLARPGSLNWDELVGEVEKELKMLSRL